MDSQVYLVLEGAAEEGYIDLMARDSGNSTSPTVRLQVTSASLEVHLKVNAGLRVPHRSVRLITPQNLSFFTNFPNVPITYSIVDQPEFGVIECLKFATSEESSDGNFTLCSSFTQNDIDQFRVRYRHTSETRPQSDSFSFQVNTC